MCGDSHEKHEGGSPNEVLHSFCIPDYSLVGQSSFGAFDEDNNYSPPPPEDISYPPPSPADISYAAPSPVDMGCPPSPSEDISYSPPHPEDISYPPPDPENNSYPSKALEELAPIELVTPVHERIIAMATGSMDTVKRKSHDFRTPANCQCELQTDDDITPLPDFKGMRTPYLKGECARFGVKAMAKKKMIAKLHEIYEHTHPLVDEEGKVISTVDPATSLGVVNAKTTKQQKVADKANRKTGRTKKASTKERAAVSEETAMTQASGRGVNDLKTEVVDYLKSDEQLYQDILLYKPLGLSYFYTKLRTAGISVTKERLSDILDNLCIAYTLPRQQRVGVKRTQDKPPL